MESKEINTISERCKTVVWMDQFQSPEIVQLRYKREFKKDPPNCQSIEDLYQHFITTGSVLKNGIKKENQTRCAVGKALERIKEKNNEIEVKIKTEISVDGEEEVEVNLQSDDEDEEEEKPSVTLLKRDDEDCLSYAEINVHEGEDYFQDDNTVDYSCSSCKFTASDLASFESHENAHSNKDYFKCSKCFFTSNNTSLFRSHKKNCKGRRGIVSGNVTNGISSDDVQCHTCDQCGKAYSSHSSLSMHKAYHSKLRPFACEKCDYRFFSEKSLKKHLSTHDKIKHLECPHCSFKCNLSGNMIIHARTHTGEKPYKCTECSYRTGNPSIIKRHMAAHRKEISYKCRKCNYRTHKSSLLANHMNNHNTESQFRCYICKEELRNGYALRYHMTKQHSEQEALECPFCDFRQKDKTLLKIHIRRHTGEKPYGCPHQECGFKAIRSQDLRKHLTKCGFIKGKAS